MVIYDERHGERKVNLQVVNLRYRSLRSSSCHEKEDSMIMITITQGLMVLCVEREFKYLKSEESDSRVISECSLVPAAGDRQLQPTSN